MLRTALLRPTPANSYLRLTITTTTTAAHRTLSTLPSNPHIYIYPDPSSINRHLLSLLPTSPTIPSLALGTTSTIPPTPNSFTTNPHFLTLLNSVLSQHAHSDPQYQSAASALASSAGSSFLQPNRRTNTGSSGASAQGGAGSAGVGGWIHVSDLRKPPDFGRIAEPEDIMGSLEVDGEGKFVDGHGNYQESGTYRVVTRDGVLGLTDFLRKKMLERLEVEEANERDKGEVR